MGAKHSRTRPPLLQRMAVNTTTNDNTIDNDNYSNDNENIENNNDNIDNYNYLDNNDNNNNDDNNTENNINNTENNNNNDNETNNANYETLRLERIQENLQRLHSEFDRVRGNDFTLTHLSFGSLDELATPGLCIAVGNVLTASKHVRSFALGPIELKPLSANAPLQFKPFGVEALATGIGNAKLDLVVLSNVTVTGSNTADEESMTLWKALFKGLRSSKTIRELHNTKQEQIEGITRLGDALPFMRYLRKLVINIPAINKEAAVALAVGIRNSNVETLSITESRRGRQGNEVRQMWRVLCHGLQYIRELHLGTIPNEGLEEVGNALPQLRALRKLSFSSLGLTDNSSQALASGMAQSETLQSLSIFCTPKRDASQQIWPRLFNGFQSICELELPHLDQHEVGRFGKALTMMNSLRKLSLSTLVLTETTARALADGIRESHLQSLELQSPIEEQPDKQGRARCIFFEGIKSSKTLRELSVNSFPDKDLYVLRTGLLGLRSLVVKNFRQSFFFEVSLRGILNTSTSLKSLELLHGDFDHNGFFRLTQGLCLSTSIENLVIERCSGITNRGVDILFEDCLRRNASLKYLTLNCCGIGRDGVACLVQHWQPHSPIQHLTLRDNAFGATGARCLAQAILDHPEMRLLDLSGNNIGYEGLKQVGDLLAKQNHLTQVKFAGCCELSSDESRKRALAEQSWLDCVKQINHRQLQKLVLTGNGFDPSVAKEIQCYVGLNKCRHVLSSYCGLLLETTGLWPHILANCQQQYDVVAASLTFYYLQEQPYLIPTKRRVL